MTEQEEKGYFGIDWGRQGGVIFGYIIILLGYYGIIANTVMFDEYGNWISFVDMDRTVLFWTFKAYMPSYFNPIFYFLNPIYYLYISYGILIVLLVLIIFFSLKEWHSSLILSILIPVLITFILFSFTFSVLALCLLFLISFVLTYKEDIPQYGVKASIWIVPILIIEGFVFYFVMFGFSMEPFIWQFMTFEGYFNILILFLTILAGSLSGMNLKQRKIRKKVSLSE